MTAALDVGPFKTRTRQRGGEKNVEFAYYLELEIFDDGSHLRMMLFKKLQISIFQGYLGDLYIFLPVSLIPLHIYHLFVASVTGFLAYRVVAIIKKFAVINDPLKPII